MPAYMLIQAQITDPVRFRDYAAAAARLVAEFGGSYRVLGGPVLQLEGAATEQKCVISEWPDREAALRFWHSAEYGQVRKLREGTGVFDVRLLEAWGG